MRKTSKTLNAQPLNALFLGRPVEDETSSNNLKPFLRTESGVVIMEKKNYLGF